MLQLSFGSIQRQIPLGRKDGSHPTSEQQIPRISMSAEEIQTAHLIGPPKLNGQVTVRGYDPRWPLVFEREAAQT
ncbi:hypothetical protein ACWFRJ_31730 [Streptomyces sp. NPDC055239]